MIAKPEVENRVSTLEKVAPERATFPPGGVGKLRGFLDPPDAP